MNYLEVLEAVSSKGEILNPRGEECKELMGLDMEIGDVHIYSWPGIRDIKHIEEYMFKEWIWYFSGDRNAGRIAESAKLWGEIKNPDGTLNSNYGYLVFYGKVPHPSLGNVTLTPFEWALQSLLKDQSTRQAVITYNTSGYNFEGNKDYICFSGETIVHSPEGNKRISEICEILKNGGRYPVYSVDFKTKAVEIQNAIRANVTRSKSVIKIKLDDGSEIKCTPNHKFFVKRKKYYSGHRYRMEYFEIEAKELQQSDSLIPINYTVAGNGPAFVNSIHGGFAYGKQTKVCRAYYAFLNGEKQVYGKVVHHKNGDPFDNRKENLELMSKSEHLSHHQTINNSVFRIRNRDLWKKRQSVATTNRNLFNKEYRAKRGYIDAVNHKVVSISSCEPEDVYNIEVEKNHNYFVGSGVLVKNCSQHQAFYIRGGKLDCYVALRSSDLIFGMTYNMPWWSIVHQQLYGYLHSMYPDLRLGTIHVKIYSAHIYKRHYALVEKMVRAKDDAERWSVDALMPIAIGMGREYYERMLLKHIKVVGVL